MTVLEQRLEEAAGKTPDVRPKTGWPTTSLGAAPGDKVLTAALVEDSL